MKFPLAAIVAAAGIVGVSAAPLRVLYIEAKPANPDIGVVSPGMRFGHAVPAPSAIAAGNWGAQPSTIHSMNVNNSNGRTGHGCGRGRSRLTVKIIQISNSFRHALGLPEIQVDPSHPLPPTPGEYRILPFIGTPPTFIKVDEKTGEVTTKGGDTVHIMPVPGPADRPMKMMKEEGFLERLTLALMSLGPFESKVVAFVLGCGLGVLLRMIWVFGILGYRAVKGERAEDDQDYTHIIIDENDRHSAEVIFIAPPEYTDEKAPIETETRN
ncbi:hypothetical protein AX16_010821 [Volvariella volvacea WC 439]|nr:hypothetical protein AX16_010821 [Volvariella volvacea WC 439]